MPEGLARTETGESIYEGDAPFFLTPEHADYYQDESAVDAAREKVRWVARFVPSQATLLDVGANIGHFVREASSGFRATGIEPSPAVVAWGRQHLGANLVQGSIDAPNPAWAGAWDAATLFDVIEHVENPRAALGHLHRCLRPGGHLFISTPDAGSLLARVMGPRWHYVDLVQHLGLFDRQNLARLLRECGFDVVATRSFGRAYRLSYIARRLRELSSGNLLIGAVAWPAQLLRLAGDARLRINAGDVMGMVARRSAKLGA